MTKSRPNNLTDNLQINLRLSCLFLEFLEVVNGWRRRIFKTFVAGLTDRNRAIGVVSWQRDIAVNATSAVDVSTAPTVMLRNTTHNTNSTWLTE